MLKLQSFYLPYLKNCTRFIILHSVEINSTAQRILHDLHRIERTNSKEKEMWCYIRCKAMQCDAFITFFSCVLLLWLNSSCVQSIQKVSVGFYLTKKNQAKQRTTVLMLLSRSYQWPNIQKFQYCDYPHSLENVSFWIERLEKEWNRAMDGNNSDAISTDNTVQLHKVCKPNCIEHSRFTLAF